MSFDTRAGSPTTTSSTSRVSDERIGAENSIVLRGSGNVLQSGGDVTSQAAVQEAADVAKGATDAATVLGTESFNLSRDTAQLVAQIIQDQADAALTARELDISQLNTYAQEARNLADASIQNSAGLAETKITGGLNKLMEELTVGLVIAAIVFVITRRKR